MVRSRFLWTAIAALMFGGLAFSFADGIGYFQARPHDLAGWLGWSSTLSAFIIGGWTWDRFVERGSFNTLAMAGLSGLLAGTLSHFTMWMVAGVMASGSPEWIVLGVGGAFLSLMVLGWATAGLAVLAGLFLGSIRVLVANRNTLPGVG